jgi:anti-sigma factor RsiW
MMALFPGELPDAMPELEEHLKQCSSCSHELEMLRKLDGAIRDLRDQLAYLLSPCPDPDGLFKFALGEGVAPDVESHIALCPDCAEQVSLIKELVQEDLEQEKATPTPRAKERIRDAVLREYGSGRQPFLQGAVDFLVALKQYFHVPSLAAGAAVAAVLLLLVMPQKPEKAALHPALSNVGWKASSSQAVKELTQHQRLLSPERKVALVMLLPSEVRLSQAQIDKIYEEVDISARLAGQYELVSPAVMKRVFQNVGSFESTSAVAKYTAGRTGANYILTFEILPSGSSYSLKGTLFREGQATETGSIFQSGLALSGIPSRITSMAAELILEAESS